MAERVNEEVGVATPVETTDRGLFEFKNKDEEGKPIKEETLASEFSEKVIVSDSVKAEYKDEEEKKHGETPVETTDRGLFHFKNKDEEGKPIKEETLASEFSEKVIVSDPVEEETTDHSLFDLIKNDTENKKPVTEETFGSEPVEYKDEDEKKHGTVVQIPPSYTSTSSDEEGDDEQKKQRKKEKKEKKGLKEKLIEKLPGHKDEVAEDTHVPLEKPHVQEAVYSEPPQQEEDPEKKSFLDKIKEKLPGHSKTDDRHDEEVPVAVPVSVEPSVEGEGEDKKGFLDKIKDKIPGLSSSKASDEKNDHEDK